MSQSMVPFTFISENNETISGENILIEIWEHKDTKKTFQMNRESNTYRLFNSKKKKQDPFVHCPFLKYLSLELKIIK